ncbi:MAG: alpha/beta hydrolase [Calothrix sp. C42_A2020_038]|nr:alpha/beta hydrolase [Calothrix sp. C42_A2020_038]
MTIPKVELKPCFLTPKKLQPEYPLLVYLPGMDGTGQLLRTQTVGLEAGFDVRCLAIPRNDLTSWEDLTNNVLDLIHAELERNSQRLVYLCGESFGGCLAQKVAIQAPYLFKRIILINPASSFKLRSWYVWVSPLMNYVPEWMFDVGAIGLLPFLASLSRLSESDRTELLETVRSVPSETIRWRVSLLREFDIDTAKLSELTQPVLIVASSDDRLLPSLEEARRLINILPNSKIEILPNSGHACLLEADINLYEILKSNDFLDIREEIKIRN